MKQNIGLSKSVFVAFLFSYLFVVAVILSIVSVSYIEAAKVAEKDAEQYNSAILGQAKNIIDAQLRSINGVMTDIAMNERIQRFLYRSQPMTENARYEMLQIIQEIARYRSVNSFIGQLYVYFKGTDIVLINTGVYQPDFFYQEITPYTNISYDQWRKMLLSYHYLSYIPAQPVGSNGKQGSIITAMQSLPLANPTNSEALGMVGVIIDEQVFRSLLKDVDLINKGVAFIIDGKNHVITWFGNKDMLKADIYPQLTSSKGSFHDNVAGKKSTVSYVSSDYNDWKYVTIIPSEAFMGRVYHIKRVNTVVFLACLGIGLLLAYFMTYRNYIPLKKLISELSGKIATVSAVGKRNEYDTLRGAINYIIDEDQQLKQTLELQKPALRANLLYGLLYGNIEAEGNTNQSLKFFNVNFPYTHFLAIIIKSNSNQKEVLASSQQERFILPMAIAKTLSQHYANMMIETIKIKDDSTALIVNIDKQYLDQYKKHILAMVQSLNDILERNLGIFLTFCIGRPYEGLSGIERSYGEAMKAVEYNTMYPENNIVFYTDIPKGDKSYYYPVDIESKLINSVKAGDLLQAKELLEAVFKRNIRQQAMSPELIRCLFYDIMATAIKVLNEVNIDYNSIFGLTVDPAEKLSACKDIYEIKAVIIEIYDRICSYINESKKSHNTRLRDNILAYINTNYADVNLNLSTIARALDITPSYVSHFFKEQMGESIVDYINRLRITKAKHLLSNESLLLNDIALMVGYIDDAALIRAFKKYEGITPGKYREAYHNRA